MNRVFAKSTCPRFNGSFRKGGAIFTLTKGTTIPKVPRISYS